MKLLVLGGTIFLGRHIVEAAVRAGDEITILTRGRHNPDLFPEVERIRGDRGTDLSMLAGRHWDAVVDTSGYVPRIVRDSARRLADAVEHYTFISSLSVYAATDRVGMDESAPVGTMEDTSIEEITGESYGPLKALCEKEVEEALPGRSASIRAGLIVGPYDLTDRFTYWVDRVARGGQVLAPGSPTQPVQFIDVRDLAEWILNLARARRAGTYNATGPGEPATTGSFLDECRQVSGSDARLVWVDQEFLAAHEVSPWQDLPLWLPDDPEFVGFHTVDSSRAIGAGLRFRPVANTIAATLEWCRANAFEPGRRAGLTPERERELLAAWEERPHSA